MIRKLRRQRLDRFALAAEGIGEVVDEDRAGDLHLDRLGKGPLRHAVAGAGLEREHRVIAGGPGMEQVGGAEVGLIARHRQAVGRAALPRVEIGCGVERQQHRNRAASDAGEDRRGDRVELHQRRRRTRIRARDPPLAGKGEGGGDRRLGVDLGAQLIERRAPFDAHGRDRGGPEFFGASEGAAGEKQRKAASQTRDEAGQLSYPNASPPGAALCVASRLILCALDVGAVFGHDHDPRVPRPTCGGTAVRTPLERIAGL